MRHGWECLVHSVNLLFQQGYIRLFNTGNVKSLFAALENRSFRVGREHRSYDKKPILYSYDGFFEMLVPDLVPNHPQMSIQLIHSSITFYPDVVLRDPATSDKRGTTLIPGLGIYFNK